MTLSTLTLSEICQRAEQCTCGAFGGPSVKPLAERIVEAAAEASGVPVETLLGRSRLPGLVLGRNAAMALIRKRAGFSFTETARIFNRDHGIAMHAVEMAKTDPATRALVERVEQLLTDC